MEGLVICQSATERWREKRKEMRIFKREHQGWWEGGSIYLVVSDAFWLRLYL